MSSGIYTLTKVSVIKVLTFFVLILTFRVRINSLKQMSLFHYHPVYEKISVPPLFRMSTSINMNMKSTVNTDNNLFERIDLFCEVWSFINYMVRDYASSSLPSTASPISSSNNYILTTDKGDEPSYVYSDIALGTEKGSWTILAHPVIDSRVLSPYLNHCCTSLRETPLFIFEENNRFVQASPNERGFMKINRYYRKTMKVSKEKVLKETKAFVQSVIADFSICPFTNNADTAGVPKKV